MVDGWRNPRRRPECALSPAPVAAHARPDAPRVAGAMCAERWCRVLSRAGLDASVWSHDGDHAANNQASSTERSSADGQLMEILDREADSSLRQSRRGRCLCGRGRCRLRGNGCRCGLGNSLRCGCRWRFSRTCVISRLRLQVDRRRRRNHSEFRCRCCRDVLRTLQLGKLDAKLLRTRFCLRNAIVDAINVRLFRNDQGLRGCNCEKNDDDADHARNQADAATFRGRAIDKAESGPTPLKRRLLRRAQSSGATTFRGNSCAGHERSAIRRRALSARGLLSRSDALGVVPPRRTSRTVDSAPQTHGRFVGHVQPPDSASRMTCLTMRSSPE